jgi:hypothetical protein
MAAMTPSPPISITVATIVGLPDIRDELVTWEAAAAACGGEVVVADGSGRPVPDGALGPMTRWIWRPGQSVFQLRAEAYGSALAPIVAITEDHCRVPADWCRRWLDAFERHASAVAIGGSVENAAIGSSIDWASFLVVQTASIPPIRSGPVERISGTRSRASTTSTGWA